MSHPRSFLLGRAGITLQSLPVIAYSSHMTLALFNDSAFLLDL